MVRRLVFIFAVTCALAAAQAADAPSNELQRRQRTLYEQSNQTMKGMRELPGVFKLRDLFQLRLVNNNWVLTTTMRADARKMPVRVKVEGLSGINVLSVGEVAKDNSPDTFTFNTTCFNDPRAVQVSHYLTISGGSLTIGSYAHLMEGYRGVTLTHGNIFDENWGNINPRGREATKFSVNIGDTQGTSVTNIQHLAPDFATLRRQHGREIDEYLRPLLRTLQIESILAADPTIAWQVFADEMKPDEKTLGEVRELLPALDSDSFEERESALRALQQKGLPVAIAISHLDRGKLSDQQNTLLDSAMAPFHPQASADLSRLRADSDFLLDCLYTDDLPIRKAAHEALQKKLGRVLTFDLEADFATRSAAVDALRYEQK